MRLQILIAVGGLAFSLLTLSSVHAATNGGYSVTETRTDNQGRYAIATGFSGPSGLMRMSTGSASRPNLRRLAVTCHLVGPLQQETTLHISLLFRNLMLSRCLSR